MGDSVTLKDEDVGRIGELAVAASSHTRPARRRRGALAFLRRLNQYHSFGGPQRCRRSRARMYPGLHAAWMSASQTNKLIADVSTAVPHSLQSRGTAARSCAILAFTDKCEGELAHGEGVDGGIPGRRSLP